jgi:hypothetical protein
MTFNQTSFKEIRVWRATNDGHFYIFECFERIPDGGFVCPYAAVHRNWNFMSEHMEDVTLRHKVFTELESPHAKVYATLEEAIANFDLNQAVDG